MVDINQYVKRVFGFSWSENVWKSECERANDKNEKWTKMAKQDFVCDMMWASNEEKQANELWIKYWNIEHSRAGEKETNEVCTFVVVVVLLNEMFELGVKCKGKVPYHMILQVWSKHEMYAMRNKQNKVENDD